MSGLSLSSKSVRYPLPFNPHLVPAVTRWLRFNKTTGTYATVSDQKGGADATQSTPGLQPAGATLNGLPAVTFDGSDDVLSEPLSAANNGTARRGVQFWFKPTTVTGIRGLVSSLTTSGGSVSSFELLQNGTSLQIYVFVSAFSVRLFSVANALALNTARHYSWEYDGGQASESDRCTLWVGGAKSTGTYSNDTGAPNAMPATLLAPTGALSIGALASDGSNGALGTFGRNLVWLGGSGGISGGGLLSAADRAALLAFEPGA